MKQRSFNWWLSRTAMLCGLAAIALASGCGGSGGGGGGGGARTASISGVVTDVNGDPVRGATVSTKDGSTTTSTTGAYVIENVRQDNLIVSAAIRQGNVLFKGQNLAVTFVGERTSSVNIVVAPERQLAKIRGVVEDRDGFRLRGASVYAYADALSSSRAITNDRGEYELAGLVSGVEYIVVAGGREFRSDADGVILNDGETRTLNFTISDSGDPTLPAVDDLDAVSWTSPPVSTRDTKIAGAVANLKRLFEPQRRRTITRTTVNGNLVEVGLTWTPVDSLELLGYGIYRARNANGPFSQLDLLTEPIAGYYNDLDDSLRPGQTYGYQITTLSTAFPGTANSESDPSNTATVRPLDDLVGIDVVGDPLTFVWDQVRDAEEYIVFLFDEFPGVGVDSLWSNSDSPTSDNVLPYSGPALERGRRYYFMVLGLANDRIDRTISTVGDFVAP